MNWTLEQLNSFVAAAEHGSFSSASRALGRAQSVVSTHIAALEAELGVDLFDRAGRLPVLTEAGQDLLAEARSVLGSCRRFDARAIAQYQGETGTLSIAMGDGVPAHVVTEVVADMAEKYPFIKMRLLNCPHMEAWQRVESGDAQLGVVYKSEAMRPQNCEGTWVATVNQVVIAPWNHPLAGREDIPPSVLANYRQIVIGDSSRKSLRHVMSSITWETNDPILALDLARRGVGWTVLPEPLVRVFQTPPKDMEPYLPPRPAVLKPMNWQLPPANIVLLWNFRYQRRDIAEWLRAALIEAFRDLKLPTLDM